MSVSDTRGSARFSLAYHRWVRPFFVIAGLGPRHSSVQLDGEQLKVQMGWGFRLAIPRSSIRRAYQRPNPWWNLGLGVRTNLIGTWAVTVSWSNIIQIDLEPAVIGHLLWGFPVGVHHLLLSLEDPEAFLRALDSP